MFREVKIKNRFEALKEDEGSEGAQRDHCREACIAERPVANFTTSFQFAKDKATDSYRPGDMSIGKPTNSLRSAKVRRQIRTLPAPHGAPPTVIGASRACRARPILSRRACYKQKVHR